MDMASDPKDVEPRPASLACSRCGVAVGLGRSECYLVEILRGGRPVSPGLPR